MTRGRSDDPTDQPMDEYVVEHVREALTTDPRTVTQGLHVARHGDAIVVSGTVESADRHVAVGEVATEIAAGMRVCNETVVVAPVDHHRSEEVS